MRAAGTSLTNPIASRILIARARLWLARLAVEIVLAEIAEAIVADAADVPEAAGVDAGAADAMADAAGTVAATADMAAVEEDTRTFATDLYRYSRIIRFKERPRRESWPFV